MPCKCARYDAAGNRILPHADMKLYYKEDQEALKLLRRFMPYSLVVIPIIEIRFHPAETFVGRLYKIYPGETKEYDITLSPRIVDYLRRELRRSNRWTLSKKLSGEIVLRRAGGIILDPLKRYGIRR